MVIFSFVILFNSYIFFDGTVFYNTLSHWLKFGLIFISYFFFSSIARSNGVLFKRKIMTFFYTNISFLIFSLFLGFLGFGFHTYGEFSAGNKSFFNGANDLGVVIFVLLSFFVGRFSEMNSTKGSKYIFLFVFFIMALSIATKFIFLALILLVFYLVLYTGSGVRSVLLLKRIGWSLVLLFIFIPSVWAIFRELGALERLIYFFEKNDDFWFIVFSGRIDYVIRDITFFANSGLYFQIFGLGGGKTVEMDFFDALFNYGWLGVVFVYAFYFYIFRVSYKASNKSNSVSIIKFVNLILILASVITGHVLFSAMAGIFISAINSLVYLSDWKTVD